MNPLSERAKQLIPQARIVSFEGWTEMGDSAIAYLQSLVTMEQLYAELAVPLPAMVAGVKGIKKASLSRFPDAAQTALAPRVSARKTTQPC